VLVDLNHTHTLHEADLFYRHQHSPYVGRELRGRIVRTMIRGITVFLNGKHVSEPVGQLLKPEIVTTN
jgi:allantoinase